MKKNKIIKYNTGVGGIDDWSHVSKPGEYSSFDYNSNVLKQPSLDKAGSFMGKYGDTISSIAGTLKPLLAKRPKPNEPLYKKGGKLIKYDDGVPALKGDTNKAGAITRVGALKGNAKDTPAQKEKKAEKPKATEKEIKGFYQGSPTAEYTSTMGIPAAAQMIPNKSKLGWVRNMIKWGPAVSRFGSDVMAEAINPNVDVQWWSRIGNLLKDISLGTAATSTVRTIGKTAQNLGEGYKKAARNTKNPTAPSLGKALLESGPEALKKSTVGKLAGKVTGNENIFSNYSKTNKNIKNSNLVTKAKDSGFTGVGNGKDLGMEGQYYYKGQSVTPEKYTELVKESTRQKMNFKKTKIKTASKKVADSRQLKKSIEYKQEIEKGIQEREALKGNATAEGPNVQKATPLQEDLNLRRRQGAEMERMREKGFADKEGKTAGEFTNWYTQEKNRIETQPKPSKLTDEEFAQKKQTELEAHSKTKEAYLKSVAENKKAVAEKNKPKPEEKVEEKKENTKPKKEAAPKAEDETKPVSTRVKRTPVGSSKSADADAGKRESTPTATPRGKKSAAPASESSGKKGRKEAAPTETKGGKKPRREFEGSAPPPGTIPGMRKKKANGAKLIKYK